MPSIVIIVSSPAHASERMLSVSRLRPVTPSQDTEVVDSRIFAMSDAVTPGSPNQVTEDGNRWDANDA